MGFRYRKRSRRSTRPAWGARSPSPARPSGRRRPPWSARSDGRRSSSAREGSIPVVSTFKEELGADTILMGLGLPDDNAHSPNEKFCVDDFYRGMAAMAEF